MPLGYSVQMLRDAYNNGLGLRWGYPDVEDLWQHVEHYMSHAHGCSNYLMLHLVPQTLSNIIPISKSPSSYSQANSTKAPQQQIQGAPSLYLPPMAPTLGGLGGIAGPAFTTGIDTGVDMQEKDDNLTRADKEAIRAEMFSRAIQGLLASGNYVTNSTTLTKAALGIAEQGMKRLFPDDDHYNNP